jgi:hypothetical protein
MKRIKYSASQIEAHIEITKEKLASAKMSKDITWLEALDTIDRVEQVLKINNWAEENERIDKLTEMLEVAHELLRKAKANG